METGSHYKEKDGNDFGGKKFKYNKARRQKKTVLGLNLTVFYYVFILNLWN